MTESGISDLKSSNEDLRWNEQNLKIQRQLISRLGDIDSVPLRFSNKGFTGTNTF